jgi:hypothetical protein
MKKRFCVLTSRSPIEGLPRSADLDDSEIVQLIIEHGRAEITENGERLEIEFQNDYD